MASPHWLQRVRSILNRSRSGRSRHPACRRRSARPGLEALEDRCVPSAGALDLTFGNHGTVTTSLGTDDDEGGRTFGLPGGKVLVVGFTDLGTNDSNGVLALLRYNADGTLDSTYQNGAKPGIPGIYQPTNNVAVGPEGQVAIFEGGTLWQFNPDGSADTTFQGGSVTPGIGGSLPSTVTRSSSAGESRGSKRSWSATTPTAAWTPALAQITAAWS